MSKNQASIYWYKQTIALFQANKWPQVEVHCRRLLSRQPKYAPAWHLRGLAAYRRGEGELAVKYLRRAVRHDANNAQYRTHLSEVLRVQGKFTQAVAAGKKAARLAPQLAAAHNNLALALLAQGKLVEAEASLRRAIASQSTYAKGHANLGNVLRQQGRLEEAVASLEQALRLQPRYPKALNMLGVTLKELGQLHQAVITFQRGVQLQPQNAQLWLNLGNTRASQEKFSQAISCYQRALALQPHYVKALTSLGTARHRLKQHQEAIHDLKQALSLKADNSTHADAYFTLGNVYYALRQPEKALVAHRKALDLKPDLAAARGNYERLRAELCEWEGRDEAVERLRQAVFQACRGMVASSLAQDEPTPLTPSHAIAFPLSAAEQLALACHTAQYLAAKMARRREQLNWQHHPAAVASQKRLRIGYLSCDFRHHATGHLTRTMYGLHDREKFEIWAYSYGPDDGSHYRQEIAQTCDHFIEIAHLSEEESAQRIYEDQIDILVDLVGHSAGRIGILALRPAPIQVHYLGFPGTIGKELVDYFITDHIATPPSLHPQPFSQYWEKGVAREQSNASPLPSPPTLLPILGEGSKASPQASPPKHVLRDEVLGGTEGGRRGQSFFDEQLVYMPHSYQVNDYQQFISEKPVSRAAEGLPEEGFIFCCFNAHYKIDPEIFSLWMRLLLEVPTSVLWLTKGGATSRQNLQREAQARGIDAQRLIFANMRPKAEHLARLRLADLFLDTPICNAHTTASDALWTGVPLITCPGDTFTSRVAASLLTAANLPELIVPNLAEYERLALKLAHHPSQLQHLRDKLAANRDTCPLFDTPRFVRYLEQAYLAMWEQYLVGEKPKTIVIPE